jgi:hypothetical protein
LILLVLQKGGLCGLSTRSVGIAFLITVKVGDNLAESADEARVLCPQHLRPSPASGTFQFWDAGTFQLSVCAHAVSYMWARLSSLCLLVPPPLLCLPPMYAFVCFVFSVFPTAGGGVDREIFVCFVSLYGPPPDGGVVGNLVLLRSIPPLWGKC